MPEAHSLAIYVMMFYQLKKKVVFIMPAFFPSPPNEDDKNRMNEICKLLICIALFIS